MATFTKTDATGSQNYLVKSGDSLSLLGVKGVGKDNIYINDFSANFTAKVTGTATGTKLVTLKNADTNQVVSVQIPNPAAGAAATYEKFLFTDGAVGLTVSSLGKVTLGGKQLTSTAKNLDDLGSIVAATPNSVLAFTPFKLTVPNVSVVEGNSGTKEVTLTLTLDHKPLAATTVSYKTLTTGTATAGTDFVAETGTVTFKAGETSKTITVTVKGDAVVEGNETIKVQFTGADLAAGKIATATITNDDPTYTLTAAAVSADEGSTATFNLKTTDVADGTVLKYTLTGVDAADVTGGSLTGTTTVTNGAATITVDLANDLVTEGAETLKVALDNGKASATTTVADTSTTPSYTLTVGAPAVAEGESGTTTLTFDLTLDSAAKADTTVSFSTLTSGTATAGTDFVAGTGSVTFAAGETTKQVTVTVNGDTTSEGDETVAVQFTGDNLVAAVTGTGTITNDDGAPPIFTLTSDAPSVVEGNSGTANLTFNLTLDSAPTADVTVNYETLTTGTATAGTDFTASTGTVTFAAGQATATVSIPVVGDTSQETSETVAVKFTGSQLTADVSATGTITNDDISVTLAPSGSTVTEGTSQTFTITASAASSSDTVYIYNVVGNTNNGTVTAATSADFSAVNGSVTLPAGSTTVTFTVTPINEGTIEGLEGFNVSLLNSSTLAVEATSSVVAIQDGASSGQNFTLTAGLDSFSGTSGADVFSAALASGSQTLQSFDSLTGGDGNDSLLATFSASSNQIVAPTLSSVDSLTFTNSGTGITTFDLGNVTGTTSVANNSSTGALIVQAIGSTAVGFEVSSSTGDTTFQYTDAALAGADDTATLKVSGANGGTDGITVNDNGGANVLETVAITSSGSASQFDLVLTNVGTTKVTASGAAGLDIDNAALNATVTTIDASAMTGDFSVKSGIAATNLTIKSGSGNDSLETQGAVNDSIDAGSGNDTIIIATANLTSADTVGGGAGNDTLSLSDASTIIDADFTNVTGVEIVTQRDTGEAMDLTLGALALAAGVITVTGATAAAADKVTVGAAFTSALTVNLGGVGDVNDTVDGSASAATLTIAAAAAGFEATDILTGGTSTSDTLKITADNDGTGANLGGATAFETITVVASTTPTDDIKITTADGTVAATKTMVVDATALTNSEAVLTFDGSLEADGAFSVTGGAGADVITAGAGNDILAGGAGNDTFIFINANLTEADTLAGGDGNDTLSMSDSSTNVDADFTKVTSVETVTQRDATDTLTITLGALALAAGVSTLTGNGAANDSVTVGSGFTGALTFNIATGNDSIDASSSTSTLTVAAAAASITAADTLKAGSGTSDVLKITADDDVTGAALGSSVTGFETITVAASTTATQDIKITTDNANVASGATLTVNASALTSSDATLTFVGSAETNGSFAITGGAGKDSITAGAGNDSVDAGSGNDTITFATANLTSADTITGGSGNDTLTLSDASTIIDSDFTKATGVEIVTQTTATHAMNLTLGSLALAAGVSTVTGNGAAADVISVGSGYTSSLTVNIETGNDSVDSSGSTATLTVAAAAASITASDTLTAGNGTSDVLKITADNNGTGAVFGSSITGFETITVAVSTTATDDLIITTNNSNVASGKSLTIDAAALTNSGATMTFNGSAEADGSFVVTGGSGNDTITGGSGNDSAVGASGDDSLVGGAGADTMTGGTGNDSLEMASSTDVLDGGDGTDTLVLDSGSSGAFVVNLAVSSGSDQVTTFGGSANSAVQSGFEAVNGAALSGALTATSSTSATTLTGGTGNDSLTGGTGNDSLTGNSGNDTLISGGGTDTLIGAAGNDRFEVTASGAGTLTGTYTEIAGSTSANDTLVISGTVTSTLTMDFTSTTIGTSATVVANTFETIDAGNLNGAGVNITVADVDSASGATLTISASELADTVSGSTMSDDKLSIVAGAGADSIVGGGVADTINGGGSADTITAGNGIDSLTGGTGADTFILEDIAAAANADTITDFTAGTGGDIFQLDGDLDSAGLSATQAAGSLTLVTVASKADTAGQLVVDTIANLGALGVTLGNLSANTNNDFNYAIASDTGAVFYDADGNWTAGSVQIATLTITGTLTTANFSAA